MNIWLTKDGWKTRPFLHYWNRASRLKWQRQRASFILLHSNKVKKISSNSRIRGKSSPIGRVLARHSAWPRVNKILPLRRRRPVEHLQSRLITQERSLRRRLRTCSCFLRNRNQTKPTFSRFSTTQNSKNKPSVTSSKTYSLNIKINPATKLIRLCPESRASSSHTVCK